MKSKKIYIITLYSLAMLIVLSWLLLCPFDNLFSASPKAFEGTNMLLLPDYFRPSYNGVPNFITVMCYIIFTLSAFLLIKEKKTGLRIVSISSFIMIVGLFCVLK